MGGQDAMRGFLFQTIASLLEALDDNEDLWTHITLEPDVGKEKVDVLLHYSESIRAIQVKSSINVITIAKAKGWCEEIKVYDEPNKNIIYELQLLGPSHAELNELCKKEGEIDGVRVPAPRNADIGGLIEQAAHRLAHFLYNQGAPQLDPNTREFLIEALVGKFSGYSTDGTKISRPEFEQLVMQWVVQIVPQTIRRALESQCDVLVGQFIFHGSQLVSGRGIESNLEFVIPFSFANGGSRTAVIEQLAMRVTDSSGIEKLYQPQDYVHWPSYYEFTSFTSGSFSQGNFSPFPLLPNNLRECHILFQQVQSHPNYQYTEWVPELYTFEVFVKFADRELPVLVQEFAQHFTEDRLEACKSNAKFSMPQEFMHLPERLTSGE